MPSVPKTAKRSSHFSQSPVRGLPGAAHAPSEAEIRAQRSCTTKRTKNGTSQPKL